jgi:hypothetical protein
MQVLQVYKKLINTYVFMNEPIKYKTGIQYQCKED